MPIYFAGWLWLDALYVIIIVKVVYVTGVRIIRLVDVLLFAVLSTSDAFVQLPRSVDVVGWGLWREILAACSTNWLGRVGALESGCTLISAAHCWLVRLTSDVLLLWIFPGTPQRNLTVFQQVLLAAILSFKLLIGIFTHPNLEVAGHRLLSAFWSGRLGLKLVFVTIQWIMWNTRAQLWTISFYSVNLIYSLHKAGLTFPRDEFGEGIGYLFLHFFFLFLLFTFCFRFYYRYIFFFHR